MHWILPLLENNELAVELGLFENLWGSSTFLTGLALMILLALTSACITWSKSSIFQTSLFVSQAICSLGNFDIIGIKRLEVIIGGPASRCIEGPPITKDNYTSAEELLQHHFRRTQQAITVHMDEMLKIAGCINDRSSLLRFVFDKINVHVQGLASLGVASEQYSR